MPHKSVAEWLKKLGAEGTERIHEHSLMCCGRACTYVRVPTASEQKSRTAHPLITTGARR